MDHIANLLPSMTISETYDEQSRLRRLERLEKGMKAAEMILCRYPEYGKTTREYVAGIGELLAEFDDSILKTLCDKRIGITAIERFMPTQAAIVEFVEKIEARRYATRDLRQGRVPEPPRSIKYEPFPKMYAAFRDEPHLLQRTFDCLDDAARAFARDGKEAARAILERSKSAV